MIEQFRRFLSSPAGKVFGIVATLALIYIAFVSVKGFFQGDTPESALYVNYIDADTGKPFKHKNQPEEEIPIMAPSGKTTGFPATSCFWTKDGQPKKEATYLLLNSQLGKSEPTFCPDCGRLVVGHNPMAEVGKTPPPTREEWFARHPRAN